MVLQGEHAAIESTTIKDGYVEFSPLIGDMVFQESDKPQVGVFVNGIPSRCTGSCDYEWDSAITPQLTQVSPESGKSTSK